MTKIEQVNKAAQKEGPLTLLPVTIILAAETQTMKGILLEDGTYELCIRPIDTSPSDPVFLIQEAIVRACGKMGSKPNNIAQEMFYHAYKVKKDIIVGSQRVLWSEYEHLFASTEFYKPKVNAKVLDFKKGDEPQCSQ